MTKVVFFFPGTGDPLYGDTGKDHRDRSESGVSYEPGVLRVYLRGCQQSSVGNGYVFPDLDIVANNIRGAFDKNEKILDLRKLLDNFGHNDGIYKIEFGNDLTDANYEIDSIALEGFSRGAVATFATARKLDDLGIPIDIIANQPVPGEAMQSSRLISRYSDLRACRNIRSALTLLGTYNLENGTLQNNFLKQMVAKFPEKTDSSTILIPFQKHGDSRLHSLTDYHIRNQLSKNGYTVKGAYTKSIKDWYTEQRRRIAFTPAEFSQAIYNADTAITKDPIYLKTLYVKAESYLNLARIPYTILTPDEASAISIIVDLNIEDNDDNLIKLALKNQQFLKIVNKVTEVTNYLIHQVESTEKNKSDPATKANYIRQHMKAYCEDVFTKSHDFLSKTNPTPKEKMQFIQGIKQAEKTFRSNALGIERGKLKSACKFIFNFITHVTGLALIVNTINKAITGNWLLFKYNRSENMIRDTRKQLVTEIEASIPLARK